MKYLQIILIAFLIIFLTASCNADQEQSSDIATIYDRVRLEITPGTNPNHLDLLMNKEMTERSIPWFNEDAAEMFHSRGGSLNIQRYHIFKAIAKKQLGDYVAAYDHILTAQKLAEKGSDNYVMGLMYLGKYLMSQYMQDYQSAVDHILKSFEHFEKSGDLKINYNVYLLEAIRGYIILGQYDVAHAFLFSLKDEISEMSPRCQANYYDTLLNIYRLQEKEKIPELLEMMQNILAPEDIYWLNIAYSYSVIGLGENAVMALEKHKQFNPQFEKSSAYHGVRAQIMELIGDHDDALKSHRTYILGVESEYQKLIDSEILLKDLQNKTAVERLKHIHLHITLALSAFIFLLLAGLTFITMQNRLRKKQEEVGIYSALMTQAQDEIIKLQQMYENKTLNKELREALMERVSVFNQFTLSAMSPNYSSKGAEENIRSLLSAKDTFLESTCKTFEALHPAFTAFLASCNLTERERGCCCLYCMGMRGNEIAAYMGLTEQSYYNFSSIIRKKLGLTEYKTNLDSFLRKKMEELN